MLAVQFATPALLTHCLLALTAALIGRVDTTKISPIMLLFNAIRHCSTLSTNNP